MSIVTRWTLVVSALPLLGIVIWSLRPSDGAEPLTREGVVRTPTQERRPRTQIAAEAQAPVRTECAAWNREEAVARLLTRFVTTSALSDASFAQTLKTLGPEAVRGLVTKLSSMRLDDRRGITLEEMRALAEANPIVPILRTLASMKTSASGAAEALAAWSADAGAAPLNRPVVQAIVAVSEPAERAAAIRQLLSAQLERLARDPTRANLYYVRDVIVEIGQSRTGGVEDVLLRLATLPAPQADAPCVPASESELQGVATEALARLSAESAQGTFVKMLVDPDPRRRAAGQRALATCLETGDQLRLPQDLEGWVRPRLQPGSELTTEERLLVYAAAARMDRDAVVSLASAKPAAQPTEDYRAWIAAVALGAKRTKADKALNACRELVRNGLLDDDDLDPGMKLGGLVATSVLEGDPSAGGPWLSDLLATATPRAASSILSAYEKDPSAADVEALRGSMERLAALGSDPLAPVAAASAARTVVARATDRSMAIRDVEQLLGTSWDRIRARSASPPREETQTPPTNASLIAALQDYGRETNERRRAEIRDRLQGIAASAAVDLGAVEAVIGDGRADLRARLALVHGLSLRPDGACSRAVADHVLLWARESLGRRESDAVVWREIAMLAVGSSAGRRLAARCVEQRRANPTAGADADLEAAIEELVKFIASADAAETTPKGTTK